MMDFEKTAKELIRDYGFDHAFLEGAIRAALLQVHRAALEQAAGVADGWLETFGNVSPQFVPTQKWANDAVRDIADVIRSLSDTPKEQT